MQCLNCNHKNEADLRFCENCGEPLTVPIKNDNETFDEAAQIVSKKPHKKWLIIIASVLVILGGGIGFLTVSGLGGQIVSNLTTNTFLESEESKTIESHYQKGLSLMAAEKYEDAIAAFNRVPKTHRRYKDANKNIESCSQYYTESMLAELEEFQKNNDYEKAYEILANANEKALKDNLVLQEEISQLQKDYKAFLLSRVKEYKNNGDYAGALAILGGCDTKILSDDKEINSETKALQDSYRQIALTNAAALLESEGYESAISYLKGGFEVLPNDSAIKEKIAEYAQYQPVALYDLEYYSASSKSSYTKEDSYKTNDGTEHFNGIGMLPGSEGHEDPWVEYKIDGSYSSLTGTLALGYNSRTSEKQTSIKIYGDDVLLYTSPTFTKGVDPEPFTVDISGVSKLKIECVGTYSWGGGNAYVYFVDTCFHK